MTKTCIQCHHNKSTDDFYKHPTTVDKLLPICKQCQKERSKLYQQTHRDVQRRSNQKWREKIKGFYGQWKKNCPSCGKEQIYTNEYALKQSISKNWKCHKCKYHFPPSPKITWKRNCPTCRKEIIYSSKGNLERAITINSSCCQIRRGPMPDWACRNLSARMKGKYLGNKHWMFGKHHPEHVREKISVALTGKHRGPPSEETRRKHRINNLKRLNELKIGTSTDKGANEWFAKYNEETHSNFAPKRFMEIGYDADGYDPDKHIWIEYDTLHHSYRCHRKRDILREKRIVKYFEDFGEPLVEFKRVLAYKGEELITKYRGYGY